MFLYLFISCVVVAVIVKLSEYVGDDFGFIHYFLLCNLYFRANSFTNSINQTQLICISCTV